jgi:hypothetical protein
LVISRKTAKKSNVAIGIFSGNAYNKQILKVLIASKGISGYDIAKVLQHERNPVLEREIIVYRTQKIYSVIQRKNARLDSLEAKGYIAQKNGKYELSFKGIIAILIDEPNLIGNIHPDYLTHKFESGRQEVTFGPFKIEPMTGDEITPQFLSDFAKKTSEYLNQGLINLDIISEDKLGVLVYLGLSKGRYLVVREESTAEGGRYTVAREWKLTLNSEETKNE